MADDSTTKLLRGLDLGLDMTGPTGKSQFFTPSQLAELDHAALYQMRAANKSKVAQELLASAEHRRFTAEATREQPMLAIPLALATPLYGIAKAMGLTNARSSTSLNQVGQGMAGIGDGLMSAVKGTPLPPLPPSPWDMRDMNGKGKK